MKLPEPSPDWQAHLTKALSFIGSQDVRAMVNKANDRYMHWDDAKYIQTNGVLRQEELWTLIKLSRIQNIKLIPLVDTKTNNFSYWLPDSVLKELHYIDQFAGGSLAFDDIGLSLPEKERYLVNSLMEEAIASSQIEGAATTRKLAKEMLREGRSPKSKAEKMIVNNYLTIRKINDFVGKPLTLDLLHGLHRSMTEGTLDDPNSAGRFRTEKDNIVVTDPNDNQLLHEPPPAHELPSRIEKFLAFANDTHNEPFIHPVVRAILLHFWLAYDHPYVDGNGRTARAVFYWYMLSKKYWLFEYMSISRIILKSKVKYAMAYLHSERDGCDATYFISYHLRAIHIALDELFKYIKRKSSEMALASNLLKKSLELNYRQQALMQHALKSPDATFTIESHKNSHNVVRATAMADLNDLAERGYLNRKKIGRKFYYLVASDLSSQLETKNNR